MVHETSRYLTAPTFGPIPVTMNDTPEQQQPLPKEIVDAREGVFTAIWELERAAFRYGYDKGFDAGWDAAWRRFRAEFMDKPPPASEQPREAPQSPPPPPTMIAPDRKPAKELVLQILTANPNGMRGVEIVQAVQKIDSTIPERTVRTALHRLKTEDEQITNVDGLWHLAI